MYKLNINGASIYSYFDTRRELSTGLYPIRIKVIYRRAVRMYQTNVSLSKNDWDRLAKAKNLNLVKSRNDIELVFNQISKAIEKITKENFFSFEKLNQRLGLNVDSILDDAYKSKIDKLNNEGKHNTADTYKYSMQSLIDFSGIRIKFSSVTVDYLKKYEKFMLSNERSYTTIAMYLRNLKAIMNEALKAGVINNDQFPFGSDKYVIPQHARRNIALSLKDVERVIKFECKKPYHKFCRDMWVFSYLCNGANFIDICNLKFENIKGNNIEFYRQKTLEKSKVKKMVVAVIHPTMQSIIEEWGNNPKPSSYIFKVVTGKENSLVKRDKIKRFISITNFHLKTISKALDLPGISTYTARHSFATVLKRSGSNIAYISESLGHTNLNVTENYLANFEDDERIKNSKLLTAF